jgi:hypothetical protein
MLLVVQVGVEAGAAACFVDVAGADHDPFLAGNEAL